MMAVSAAEVRRLEQARPGATVTAQPDGSSVVRVADIPLPSGWSKAATTVRWLLSPGYPAAQPDCFYADPDLALVTGAAPANTGMQPLDGSPLLWFSWHLPVWRPGRDDLLSYLRFIERRLADVR